MFICSVLYFKYSNVFLLHTLKYIGKFLNFYLVSLENFIQKAFAHILLSSFFNNCSKKNEKRALFDIAFQRSVERTKFPNIYNNINA